MAGEAYRILILPDHPTPISIRTHSSDPVPYLLYDSSAKQEQNWCYTEAQAQISGHFTAEGHKLTEKLLIS
jgi:2,3-bisphosphoglycerate-independent phosphoglycerate mutase